MYMNYMGELRERLKLINSILAHSITTGSEGFDTELVFIQFRKILESIAFSSLISNKAAYAVAFRDFESHWNAKRILDKLEKINPSFFPRALGPPQIVGPGEKHFPEAEDGFLTRADFVALYNHCGKVLHTRNPFTRDTKTIQIGYSAQEWASRIRKLLEWHVAYLVSGDVWVINLPEQGLIHTYPASPTQTGSSANTI